MRNNHLITVTGLLMFVASLLPGASVVSVVTTSSSGVTVAAAGSATEQLAQASRLWQEMGQTPAPKKFQLFAEAWANLTLVRKVLAARATSLSPDDTTLVNDAIKHVQRIRDRENSSRGH